jgi:hypothetical protein
MADLELGFWKASVKTKAMPGAREALEQCHRAGTAIAVVSNTSFGEPVIRYELGRYGPHRSSGVRHGVVRLCGPKTECAALRHRCPRALESRRVISGSSEIALTPISLVRRPRE